MMNVQLMRRIVDDVERGALPEAVAMAAERWSGQQGVSSLVYVRSSANHLFRLQLEGRPHFLRLSHAEEADSAGIAAELDFVRLVADSGLAVALPAPSKSGKLIEEVSCEGQRYYAVVFEGLLGNELDVDDLDEARFRAWGSALGVVHCASQTFPRRPARPRWIDLARAARDSLPPSENELARIITSGLEWLESLALPEQDYGLIHGDFELDNLIWEGQRVQALDFDDAAYAWYGLDIAVTLHDVWSASDGSDTAGARCDERFQWFAEGYRAVRPLPGGLPERMPRLLNLLLAVKMARLLRAYATTNDENCPEWLTQMRTRHESWLAVRRAVLRRSEPSAWSVG